MLPKEPAARPQVLSERQASLPATRRVVYTLGATCTGSANQARDGNRKAQSSVDRAGTRSPNSVMVTSRVTDIPDLGGRTLDLPLLRLSAAPQVARIFEHAMGRGHAKQQSLTTRKRRH